MRVIDYFRRGLGFGSDLPAFVHGAQVRTWGEAAAGVEGTAAGFAAAGLDSTSKIGVLSPNDVDAFVAILGAFRLGAVWTPVNARNSTEANQHWFSLMGCNALVYHSSLETEAMQLAPLLKAPAVLVCLDRPGQGDIPSLEGFCAAAVIAAPDTPDDPDAIASVFATGGTTGLSKAASWSSRTWETLVSTFWQCLPIETTPVHLVAGPMTHAAGVLALCSLAGGATNVILPKADPGQILEAIERHGVTHVYLPPTLLYSLLDHPDVRKRDYRSLRYLVLAASPVAPAKLREAMEVFGPVICQSYGQAEAPMFMAFLSTADLLSGDDERWSSCGRPTLNTRVEVMSEDGTLLGPNERGEIVSRGQLVMPGYYANPAATAEVGAHGWHHTGDIGYRDRHGFIYIVDRAKDMIISGGFNVYSDEVEQVILSHPAVLDCAVVGVPDPKWGEAVKAVVELKAGCVAVESEIIAIVKQALGSVHSPKSVEFWSTLPRSPAGKILKRDIRAGFWKDQLRAVG
jgi:acyl-CoA synthetase (AMP-forming)/AMP-acid ligase II